MFGFDSDQLAEWQAQQSASPGAATQRQEKWLAEFRHTHPFCSSWTDAEVLRWRNNPLFKPPEHCRDRFLCVVCQEDCGPGTQGSFVVCSFRCAHVIAEKEYLKLEERTKPKDIKLETP
jgi:hypothetical protein